MTTLLKTVGGTHPHRPNVLIVQKEDITEGSKFMGFFRAISEVYQYAVVQNAEAALQLHFTCLRQDVFVFTSDMFPSGAMSASDAIDVIRSQEMHETICLVVIPPYSVRQPRSPTLYLYDETPLDVSTIYQCITSIMQSRAPTPSAPSAAGQELGPHPHLRVLIAIHDTPAGDAVADKIRQVNPSWKVNRVALAEGVVVAHPTYDIIVMGEEFANGMMCCSTAIGIVRRNEQFRRLRQQRLVVLASFLPNSIELGADILWDQSVGIDAMRTDLHGALASRS